MILLFFYFCVVFPLAVDNFVHTLDYTAELQGRQIKKKTCAMMTTHMLTICHCQFRTLLLLLVYRTILPIHLLLYTLHRIINTLVFTRYTSSLYFQLDVSTIVLWVIITVVGGRK